MGRHLPWGSSPIGSDLTGNGSQSQPWASVTNALRNATTNDIILVAGGVYTQQVNFTADKDVITIQGGYDATAWTFDPANQQSVIQSTGGNSPVFITYGATSNTLNDLTLRGGTGSLKAGVEIQNSSGQTLFLFLNGCTITGNVHGVYCPGSTWNLTLRNCLIARNTGIAINAAYSAGNAYIYNCTISDNGGDGFWSRNAAGNPGILPFAKNTIFSHNAGYGVHLPPHWTFPQGTFENCLFFANANGHYHGPSGDAGGIKTGRDPLYLDHANNDYRLQNGSPAAASGVNLSSVGVTNDIRGMARPQGGAWDMGAFEGAWTGEGSLPSVVHVQVGGVDAPTRDGSTNQPFATPGYALGYVAASGEVRVASGAYTSLIAFGPDKDGIMVRGGYDPVTWSWGPSNHVSRIKAASASVVHVANDCADARVACLTLWGATATDYTAIRASCAGETFNVDGCMITNNYRGVIPFVATITLVFRNTLIARNAQEALYALWVNSIYNFYNCTVAYNGSHGVYANSSSTLNSRNSLFTHNAGWGIFIGSAISSSIGHSLFFGNTSGHYSGIFTDAGGNKLGRNPLYVDATNNNFRVSDNSPAAAAGTTNVIALGVTNDILGISRPQPVGGAFDMGVYEGSGEGEPPMLPQVYISKAGSDITGNGTSTNPWASISYGLAYLAASGAMYIASGVYTEQVQLASGNAALLIRGGYNPVSWQWAPKENPTVIVGPGGASAVVVSSGAYSNTLSYLTLRGSTAAGASGIYSTLGDVLIIDGCTITGNTVGVRCPSVSPGPTVTIKNSIIARNVNQGVLADWTAGTFYLYNCTVADNGGDGLLTYSAGGGGVGVHAKNTLFTGNSGYGLNRGNTPGASIEYCLFHANTSGPTNGLISDLGNNMFTEARTTTPRSATI